MDATTTPCPTPSGRASPTGFPMPRSGSSSAAGISPSSRSPASSPKPWQAGLPSKPVDNRAASGPYLVCGADQLAKEAGMEIQDLDRIRFVTQRFGDLQGLRYLVPLGLLLLSGAGAAWLANWPLVLLQAVSFSGAFALMLGARRYYRNTF